MKWLFFFNAPLSSLSSPWDCVGWYVGFWSEGKEWQQFYSKIQLWINITKRVKERWDELFSQFIHIMNVDVKTPSSEVWALWNGTKQKNLVEVSNCENVQAEVARGCTNGKANCFLLHQEQDCILASPQISPSTPKLEITEGVKMEPHCTNSVLEKKNIFEARPCQGRDEKYFHTACEYFSLY